MRKKNTPLWLMAGCAIIATGKFLGVDKFVCKTSKSVSGKIKAYFKKAKDEVEDTVEDIKDAASDSNKD